ncbi:MAG TPA: hypothetical protein VN638_02095 [Nitrospiraceae bacterium]|jgi:hypothetical protein|nr:hypothetical protein [Nitrospiraceae bacterium]
MTKTQATDLQTKWKQQDQLPLCEHPIQELSRSCLRDNGHLLRTYHCRECGEAIVRTYTSSTFSGMPLDRLIRNLHTSQT